MSGKITLITPPDFYENGNFSVLFIGMSEDDQEKASIWLANHSYPDANFYVYQGEPNPAWLLYALARADVKFLNYKTDSAIIQLMGSYILSRPNVYWACEDDNLKSLFSHINNQSVSDVEQFLEKIFSEQK